MKLIAGAVALALLWLSPAPAMAAPELQPGARWDPCGIITYTTVGEGFPGWDNAVDDAVAQVSEASGLRIQRALSNGAVRISWEAMDAGSAARAGSWNVNGIYVAGNMFLNPAWIAYTTNHYWWRGIIIHEFGHILGLAHSDTGIMRPDTGSFNLNASDRAAFASVGGVCDYPKLMRDTSRDWRPKKHKKKKRK